MKFRCKEKCFNLSYKNLKISRIVKTFGVVYNLMTKIGESFVKISYVFTFVELRNLKINRIKQKLKEIIDTISSTNLGEYNAI